MCTSTFVSHDTEFAIHQPHTPIQTRHKVLVRCLNLDFPRAPQLSTSSLTLRVVTQNDGFAVEHVGMGRCFVSRVEQFLRRCGFEGFTRNTLVRDNFTSEIVMPKGFALIFARLLQRRALSLPALLAKTMLTLLCSTAPSGGRHAQIEHEVCNRVQVALVSKSRFRD